MSPEQDDHRDEDEHEDYASRSIFSAGWFRAVLVLTVLAIVVVVSLPYLLNWFEPAPPSSQAPPSAPAVAQVPKPDASPTPIVSPAPAASPAAPAPPKAAEKPAPPPAKMAEKPSPAPTLPPSKTTEKPAPLPAASAVKPVAQMSKPLESARAKEPVGRPAKPASAATPPSSPTGSYWVQVGVFKEQGNAEGLAKSLRSSGFPVEVTRITRGGGANPGTYYMVRAGSFPDRDRALAARDELKTKGHPGILAQGPAK